MINCFLDTIKSRRSVYQLNRNISLSESEVVKLSQECLKYVPTAFNMQSSRLVLLFGESHQKLWEITRQALQKIVKPENFATTEQKIESFAKAFGTFLFFEDQDTIELMKRQFPLYAQNFNVWAQQGNAMLQYAVWVALSEQRIGASLQHYNPLIDDQVRSAFNLSPSWQLIAQMPFGGIEKTPPEKDFIPLERRMKIFY